MIEYKGQPLAGLLPLSKIEGYELQLWVWVPLWLTELEAGRNWYKLDETVSDVLLAFGIESKPEQQTIGMLNPFPLPQVGEYGIVETTEKNIAVYKIQDLPLESRQRWVGLGDALRKLSEPLLWPPFSERTKIASNDTDYRDALRSFAKQQQLTRGMGEPHTDLIVREAMLRASHQHIEELHAMLRKDNLLAAWEEIQRMASDLTQNYYNHHLALTHTQETPEPSEHEQEVVVQPALLTIDDAPIMPVIKKKRNSHPTQPPTPIVSKKQEHIHVLSNTFSRNLTSMLRDKTMYKEYKEHNVARAKQTFDKQKGSMIIDIKPAEGEGWDTVINALNTLGDEVVDTYFATMAIAIDRNGVQSIRTPFQVNPDDILAICGKEKSNGSYKTHQRADVIKHLKTLSMARVVATLPGKPAKQGTRGRKSKSDQGTVIRAEGAIVDLLSFKIGEYSTITGEEVWERRSIAIGEWATMIPDLNSQTATMLRQVLKYSAKNQRYQKRLGVYLTFMFRINAKHGGRFPHDISMGAILEGAGIIVPRQAGEFRTSIERALEQLKTDKVLGNYWQVIDSTLGGQTNEKEVREHARGWVDLWLDQKWNFSPPDNILEQYKNLFRPASQNTLEQSIKGNQIPE